jgi:hypothetical protein
VAALARRLPSWAPAAACGLRRCRAVRLLMPPCPRHASRLARMQVLAAPGAPAAVKRLGFDLLASSAVPDALAPRLLQLVRVRAPSRRA